MIHKNNKLRKSSVKTLEKKDKIHIMLDDIALTTLKNKGE